MQIFQSSFRNCAWGFKFTISIILCNCIVAEMMVIWAVLFVLFCPTMLHGPKFCHVVGYYLLKPRVDWSVDHFNMDHLNISKMTVWTIMIFCTEIYGLQRINPNDFGDPLTFDDEFSLIKWNISTLDVCMDGWTDGWRGVDGHNIFQHQVKNWTFECKLLSLLAPRFFFFRIFPKVKVKFLKLLRLTKQPVYFW